MQFVAVPGASLITAAPGVAGSVTQGLGDLNSAWNVGDTLTANDKALVGWTDPNTSKGPAKINTAADMLSYYRHSGQITGEITSDFVTALKTAIANGKGVPINPALLMSKSTGSNPLSSQTASALFSILNPPDVAAGS